MENIITKKAKPIIEQTDQFETILIRIVIPFEEKEENIGKLCLLPPMLAYMCEKYPSEEEFKIAKLKNYVLRLNCGYNLVGTSGFFVFNLTTIDPKLLPENKLEEAIELLYDCIYHPKTIDNGFDNSILEREKEKIRLNIKNSKKNLRGYLANRIPNLVDNKGIYRRNIANYIDQLDSVNSKNLYDFYKETIQTKIPFSFIIGNVDKKEIETILNKYFYQNKKQEISFSKNYNHFLLPFRSEAQFIVEEKDFKQSAVALIYKVNNLKEEDRITFSFLKYLLASAPSKLLFNKLRTEEGLVYSVYVTNKYRYGLLELYSFTDADKLDLAKEKTIEVINSLKNEDLVTPLLKDITDDFQIATEEEKDNKYYLLDDIIDDFFDISCPPNEWYQKMLKIKAADIKDLVERLSLDTIFYVKERSHE